MDTAQKSNKRLVFAIGFVGLLAVLAIGARTVVADAYGGPLDAAAAIPSDMDAVVVFDLLQLRDFADSDLVEYSIRAAQEAGELPEGEPGVAFIEFAEDELGIDIDEDVMSWIGRSAAIGVGGDLSEPEPESVIAAVSVRNEDEAWSFVDLLVRRTLEEQPDAVASETTVAGRRVVILESGEDPAHIGVNGDHLVFADRRESIEEAYRTLASGDSVLNTEWFGRANNELDRNAWVKAIVDPAFVNDAVDEMNAAFEDLGISSNAGETPGVTSIGLSYGLDGEQFSMEAFLGFDELPVVDGGGPLSLETIGDLAHTPNILWGVEVPNDFGEQLLTQFEEMDPNALEEVRQMSEDFLGVDFVTAGLAELSSHLIFSLSLEGLDDFDVSVAAGLNDPQPLVRAFEDLRSNLIEDGADIAGRDGLIRFPEGNLDVGVLGDEFVFRMDQSPGDSVPFIETAGYEWLARNFPDGAFFYMDIGDLLKSDDVGLDPETIRDLEAMRAAATMETGSDFVRVNAILEINLADR